ncbi:MAG: MFS transporter, partial [Rothia dentocariosa]
YGLTQALLQLPLGMLSDKIGRKKVIYLGMGVFALGSFWAAAATDVHTLIMARAVQGAGAVSAAVTALLADLTREEVRTRAMSLIGLSIGLTFSASLVLSPMLSRWMGVNVPNATLMMIMDADRFGISGLHQLRGRVGRGGFAGTCLLVTRQEAGGVSRERLDAVASTTDGFKLSQIDLQQRREGDILGAAQSGKKSTLKFLRALADATIIERAREDARALIAADPTLAKHPNLARTIDRALDADREAFLGRG